MKISLLLLTCEAVAGQESQGHSHNDYEQPLPLVLALRSGMASVEVDVFAIGDQLLVGHTRDRAIQQQRTLQSLYWEPLSRWQGPSVELLVDFKEGPDQILEWLELQEKPRGVSRVILTGVRPSRPPRICWLTQEGTLAEFIDHRLPLNCVEVSARWRDYFSWKGRGEMPEEERLRLEWLSQQIHQKSLRLRFWGAPDTIECWQVLRQARVDRINSDQPEKLGRWLLGTP